VQHGFAGAKAREWRVKTVTPSALTTGPGPLVLTSSAGAKFHPPKPRASWSKNEWKELPEIFYDAKSGFLFGVATFILDSALKWSELQGFIGILSRTILKGVFTAVLLVVTTWALHGLADSSTGVLSPSALTVARPKNNPKQSPVKISWEAAQQTQVPLSTPSSEPEPKPVVEKPAPLATPAPIRRTEARTASTAARTQGTPGGSTTQARPEPTVAGNEGPLVDAPTSRAATAIAPVTNQPPVIGPAIPRAAASERRADGPTSAANPGTDNRRSVGSSEGPSAAQGAGTGGRPEVAALSSLRGCIGLGVARRALADALARSRPGLDEVVCSAEGRRFRVVGATDRNGFSITVAAPPSLALGDQCQESFRLVSCLSP
jgi:hypothetical protein